MDFGQALTHLKAGRAIARPGWLSNGMSLCVTPGLTVHLEKAAGLNPAGSTVNVVQFIATSLRGNVLVAWPAPSMDLLADDWIVLDPGEAVVEPAPKPPLKSAARKKPLPKSLTDAVRPSKRKVAA